MWVPPKPAPYLYLVSLVTILHQAFNDCYLLTIARVFSGSLWSQYKVPMQRTVQRIPAADIKERLLVPMMGSAQDLQPFA